MIEGECSADQPESYVDRVYPGSGHTSWPAITERQFDEWEDAGGIGIAFWTQRRKAPAAQGPASDIVARAFAHRGPSGQLTLCAILATAAATLDPNMTGSL